MDTSGTNLGGTKTASTRPDLYSKEELASILKFGAANIFNNDANQTKLEEMDLDDVMNKAEAYDTENGPSGTSLGGAAFLNQFEIQDVKADMTSWEDIIPAEARAEVDKERKLQAASEQDSRRAAAKLSSGAYLGDRVSPGAKSSTKKKAAAPTRKTDAQRAVELTDRDIRNLIRGIHRFGDVRYRYDTIVKDARLEAKSQSVILNTVDGITKECRAAVSKKIEKWEEMKANKEEITTAIKTKSTLITYNGVSNINAETLVQRADELKILHSCSFPSFCLCSISADVCDTTDLNKVEDKSRWSFPVTGAKATANWRCEWTSEDDAALLVGVWRHGHGGWDSIQKDPSLGLRGKFYLDDVKPPKGEKAKKVDASEKKIPSASHLIRRTDYLLGLLHDLSARSDGKDRGNDSSTRKPKVLISGAASGSGSTTKKPRAKKVESKKEESKPKLAKSKSKSAKVVQQYSSSEGESEASSLYDSMDEAECKESLRPVKSELQRLQKSETASTDGVAKEARIALYKECLSAIGARIDVAKREKKGSSSQDTFEKHLCSSSPPSSPVEPF